MSNRVFKIQPCPALEQTKLAAGRTCAKSASSRTIIADLPPSSNKVFLMVFAAFSVTRLPVVVEPVNETTSTRGSDVSTEPMLAFGLEVRTLSTPVGMSGHCEATRPIIVAAQGVLLAALRTTVQPAASAGIIFCKLVCTGAFQ